jgi:hypothetical protein
MALLVGLAFGGCSKEPVNAEDQKPSSARLCEKVCQIRGEIAFLNGRSLRSGYAERRYVETVHFLRNRTFLPGPYISLATVYPADEAAFLEHTGPPQDPQDRDWHINMTYWSTDAAQGEIEALQMRGPGSEWCTQVLPAPGFETTALPFGAGTDPRKGRFCLWRLTGPLAPGGPAGAHGAPLPPAALRAGQVRLRNKAGERSTPLPLNVHTPTALRRDRILQAQRWLLAVAECANRYRGVPFEGLSRLVSRLQEAASFLEGRSELPEPRLVAAFLVPNRHKPTACLHLLWVELVLDTVTGFRVGGRGAAAAEEFRTCEPAGAETSEIPVWSMTVPVQFCRNDATIGDEESSGCLYYADTRKMHASMLVLDSPHYGSVRTVAGSEELFCRDARVQLVAGDGWRSNAVPLLVLPEQATDRFFEPPQFWAAVTAQSGAAR